MGAVKNHFLQVEESLQSANYAQALELLKPWGEDAPRQLWATLEAMAETEPELPSHSLPKATRELWLTPKDFRALAKNLERQSITAVNVGLALDLLARDYGHE